MKTGQMKLARQKKNGFTLIELLVVMGIIMILASLLLPSLARAKATANRIKCISNNKQVQIACQMYVDDNDDRFPARLSGMSNWVAELKPYYINPKVLQCPSDRFTSERSMLINAFGDWFKANLNEQDWRKYVQHRYPLGLQASVISDPSQTITFGERDKNSFHVHMDIWQGPDGQEGVGNDMTEIEHDRHSMGREKTGGSNFAFADGSVRYLKYGKSTTPINLWAVVPEWRSTPIDPD